MGLFNKKEKKGERKEIPKLPELPRLPELPEIKESSGDKLPQLPQFPNDSLGDKFSQDTIKEAVTGKKEDNGVGADESAEERKMQKMREPHVREVGGKKEPPTKFVRQKTKEAEPIFIRIDRFEEGAHTFEEVKRKTSEIEKMFNDIKKVKENEEKELEFLENEIKNVKEKIEQIDSNIFSQVR